MIYQISTVKTQTEALPRFNKGLVQVRNIQRRLKSEPAPAPLPDRGLLWSPHTAGPYVVPVTRWIE
jgi:hypothetical protein